MNLESKFDKTVVFDTNILLDDPTALSKFDQHNIIIPMAVLEELDGFKTEKSEVGRNARLAAKILEKISSMGKSSQGISIDNDNAKFLGATGKHFNTFVQIMPTPAPEKQLSCMQGLPLSECDNKLLNFCLTLSKDNQHPTLITKDINLRIKARSLGLESEDLDKCPIENNEYKGFTEVEVDTCDLKLLNDKHALSLIDNPLKNNEFLVVRSNSNHHKYKIFRHLSTDRMQPVDTSVDLWGFKAKNSGQAMALDLLLDDAVPLVFLMGPAGTGKTLLTLLAGLHKVMVEKTYSKMFIARPLVSLGADIGFIPGDLDEKLFHWMHPFYDNLEFAFKEMDLSGETFDIPKDRMGSGGDYSRKKGFRNGKGKFMVDEFYRDKQNDIHERVNTLKHRGLLGLEAITHMRGRTLPGQFMFVDEAQNLSPEEIKTIITRAGQGTKVILAGDPYQIDSHRLDFFNNGLITSSVKLRGESLVGLLFLENSERSPLAQLAIQKL